MTIHDVIQGTEDWHWLRMGRIGSSEASVLLVDGKSKSGLGTGAISLLFEKAAEILTGEVGTDYISEDMQRGSELEPFAVKEYENQLLQKVDRIGYVSDGDYFGYSPDGFIGDDGLTEFKCPSAKEFVRYAITKEVKKEYIGQMQWGLWITKRKWIDYVVFHPDFEKNLIVTRFYPDPVIQEKLTISSNMFVSSMEKILEKMRK